ncbi:MAG: sugar phosphate isomerase/epimerase [Clostridia bacterium]|nr:sugar phosphate isomerase/epimerase [Clostridia bacterium]
MIDIGISTSNFYPLPPEDALALLGTLDARTAEIFVNTRSEASPAFAHLLKERAAAAGVSIRSLHSYTSAYEGNLLFSLYERRFEDGLEVFKEMYEAAAICGASFVVLHGDKETGVLPPEEHARRYEKLFDLGQTFGVTLLQENVVKFRAASPDFVRSMRHLLGDKAQFVLDLKQCRRTGVPFKEMLDAMAGAVRHVHVSDGNVARDCIPPGTGDEDFENIFTKLKDSGFDGVAIIELYRAGFKEPDELRQSAAYLRSLL